MEPQRPILVVDDSPAIQEFLEDALRFAGYRTIITANGNDAFVALQEQQPSLILLDIMMPVLSGTEFLKRLRQHEARPPVIVMTAGTTGEQLAHEFGAAASLQKPFDLKELLQLIAATLQHF